MAVHENDIHAFVVPGVSGLKPGIKTVWALVRARTSRPNSVQPGSVGWATGFGGIIRSVDVRERYHFGRPGDPRRLKRFGVDHVSIGGINAPKNANFIESVGKKTCNARIKCSWLAGEGQASPPLGAYQRFPIRN